MSQKQPILSIRMGDVNISNRNDVRLPEVMVFADPNGSGNPTIIIWDWHNGFIHRGVMLTN